MWAPIYGKLSTYYHNSKTPLWKQATTSSLAYKCWPSLKPMTDKRENWPILSADFIRRQKIGRYFGDKFSSRTCPNFAVLSSSVIGLRQWLFSVGLAAPIQWTLHVHYSPSAPQLSTTHYTETVTDSLQTLLK